MGDARDRIQSHFERNLKRVAALLALQGMLGKIEPGEASSPGNLPDNLRAAVVLLHATLEDLVRSVAEWKMPAAPSKAFERVLISIPGSDAGKPRVTLAELVAFRGRSVDSVIVDSVNRHLETATYNNIGDIIRLLDDLDIEVRIPGLVKSELSAVIARRHRIVHRVDRDPPDRAGVRVERPIEAAQVHEWADSVRDLGILILEAT